MHLTKETFDFLAELRENNNRDWFQENKARYDQISAVMKSFVQAIIEGLAQVDPYITKEIPAAKCMFRIYRDTRFSLDKTPYKYWLGAGISINGRKLEGPEYYIHIQPGNSFLAVGYWKPKPEHLASIRQEIDYNGEEFHEILKRLDHSNTATNHPGMNSLKLDRNETLKRPPVGYSKDHPDINLLKLKSFTISCTLADDVFYAPDSLDTVLKTYQDAQDFKRFIHQAIGEE